MTLKGVDSSTPLPTAEYEPYIICPFYVAGATPHVWTQTEWRATSRGGIKGGLPIAVPAQDRNWWVGAGAPGAELAALANEMRRWGVPDRAPVCLDLENRQTAIMNAQLDPELGPNRAIATGIAAAWRLLCVRYGWLSWIYAGEDFHNAVDQTQAPYFRWLARWPQPAPSDPQMPVGYQGWQDASLADRDESIFNEGLWWLAPDMNVQMIGTPA